MLPDSDRRLGIADPRRGAQDPFVASVHGEAPTRLGVSVVICCHNSAILLPQTIAHLKRQRVDRGLEWEVLVVDNASSDSTVQVARQCWGADVPAAMRIVCESRLGLCYARERALQGGTL